MKVATALVGAALALGCSVRLTDESLEPGARNTCETSSDCAAGTCRFGACVAPEGEVDALLLEITPPTSALGIGGVRALTVERGFSQSRRDFVVNLPRSANISGFVRAYSTEAQAACLRGADSTLPVRVTFTPRERRLGLSGGTYVATTTTTVPADRSASHACRDAFTEDEVVHEFSVNVPAGQYDIYVEPQDTDDSCVIVPSLIEEDITLQPGSVCLKLAASPPEELRLLVEWTGSLTGIRSLDGWSADIVHPITGKVLSTRGTVSAERTSLTPSGATAYEVPLSFSRLPGILPRELLRLTPPPGVFAPVIQLARSALGALGDALVGNLAPFPAPVRLEGWVWEESGFERSNEIPVAATVSLTATKLSGVAPGIFASYSATAEVGEDGRLSVVVLPGEYRVRVVPSVGSGLSAFETTLEVPCPRSAEEPDKCAIRESEEPEIVHAGRLLLVPDAARVSGTVASPLGGDVVEGATVTGVPGLARARVCRADAGPECAAGPLGILDLSLGENRFAPRTVTTLVEDSRFVFEEADCALCAESAGAIYDFSVRPLDGSGFPWGTRSGIVVEGDLELGSLTVPLPLVHRGRVQLPRADGPVPIGGALIRAYALRLADGAISNDPELPACEDSELTELSACIRSVLQVAETRAADDGTFSLFVPAEIR